MAKADMLAKKAEDERKKQEQEARKAQEAALRHQKEAARAAMKEAERSSKAAQEFRYKQATASQSRENAAAQAAAESNKTTRLGMVADYFGQGAKQSAVNVGQAIGALGRTFTNDAQAQQMVPYLGMNEDLQAENAIAKEARSAYNADAAQKAVATARQLATQQQALDTKYAGKNTAADWLLKTGAQGVGGMVPTIVGSAIPGVGAAAGITASVLQGMGGGYTDALEDGANEGNAMANAMLQGAIAGGVEKLVGGVPGFKQAGGWLDDAVEGAVGKLGSKAAQGAARWGLNAAGEGLEEVAEEALGEAAARFAYGKRGSIEQTLAGEKTVPELMSEYGQTFVGGALVGGLMDAAGNVVRGAMGKNSVPELEKPAQQQSAQQPAAQVPELQQTTQEPVAQEAKPLTIDRTKFTGTKYADAAARTIDSAVAAGMKDSGSARTIVELAAQVAGDTGLQFELKSGEQVKAAFIARQTEAIARLEATPDRTDAQTRALEQMREALRKVESGEAIVNGDITGNTVVLNLEAGKPLNRIVGHELTHRLEAVKKQYGSVADAVRSYAAVKGIDYEAELAQRQALYEGVEGADPEGELVADLVGDLLFTDYDFVTHLHAENRNLFQKIWDEIKHLYRMATAGSAEARQLEQLMHNFQKAYNEAAQQKNTATEGGGKYSLNVNAAGELHKALYDTDYRDDVLLRDESPAIMLAQKGVKNLPMVMKASHIRENVFTEAEAEKLGLRVDAHTHYHGLGEEFYLKVIDGLDNVKLAYRGTKNAEDPSRRENYFLLISEFKDGNGDTINVPVYIDERGQVNRVHIDVNKISTAFGRKNFQDYIVRQIQKGNLVRIKNRDIQTSERGALIAPDYGMNASVENNITQTARNVNGQSLTEPVEKNDEQTRLSLSSMANTFFGDPTMSADDFAGRDYHETEGYKNYVDQCVNNYRQSRGTAFDEGEARAATEEAIDGIVKVALAAKRAGYDIMDDPAKRDVRDSKKRLLFSSLEPNSEYTTSSDISTICDKRKNFAEIYDAIVRAEEAKGVPAGKRFFDNVDNYFVLHKIMADKGLTQPCRQCYVESMRKNLAPMANAFMRLVTETDPNNKANDQLYHQKGASKGGQKTNNAALRERVLATLGEYGLSVDDLSVEKLTTANGLAELKVTAPLVYEAFNSFYGQSKPKMPKEATPFRFGELTALLTNDKGEINQTLVNRINSTGGFRLQSYSDFQLQNYVDVLQVLFEAGTLGLRGHAYTKVPAFLDATKGTNLKRNISIFMYKDGDEWKLDKNDSFPMELEEIYDIVRADESGNTGIIAVSQNDDMSAWIMANDMIGYGIPFHKSGLKMGTVRDTDVKTDDGRTIKGYSGTKDHTKQQTEVWAKAGEGHKALTKVKKGIDIYSFWDFDNADGLSKNELIEKNVKAYIDRCEAAGYLPKFRDYVLKNDKVLAGVLKYAQKLGYADANATIEDISFAYKGYRIPYGYYKFLGDFSMFDAEGNASPHEVLSLEGYDFDEAASFFDDAEGLRRNELLQQIANGTERERYRNSDMTTEELERTVGRMRQSVVDDVLNHGGRSTGAVPELDFSAPQIGRRNSLSRGDESVRAGRGWDVYGRDIVDGQVQGVPELRGNEPKSASNVEVAGNWNTGLDSYPEEMEEAILDGGNRVIKDYQSVVDVVREAFANVKKKSRAYFGNLSADKLEQLEAQVENLPEELKGNLFKKGKSYSVTATMDSIRHIVEDKGSMTQADVVDYLCKMPQIISNPDRVSFTYYIDSKGQKEKALRFEKAFEDGKMISVEVVSNKKRSLSLQSIFMERADYGNKKRAAKTLPSVNGGATAESGGAGQLFNSNIADDKRSVKPNTVVASKESTGVPELEPTEPAAQKPVPELLPGETYLPKHAIGADLLQNTPKGYPTKQAQTETLRATAEKHGVDEETASIMTNQTSETISRDEQRERGKLLVDETGEELFLQGVMSDIESNRELNGEDLNGVQYLLDETLVRLKSATGNERTKLLEQVKKLARAEAYTKSEAGRKLSSGDRHGPQAAKSLVRAEEILAKGARDWANDNPREQKSVEDLAQQIEQEVQGRSVDNIEMLLNKLIDLSKLSRESKHTVRKNVDEIAKAIRQSKGEATEIVNILDKMLGNGVVQFSDDVVEKVLEAYQEAEQYPRNSRQYAEAQSRAHAALAATMKAASWSDKTKAWRYMSMLSSPRTSIKNTLGNISMGGITATKNAVKAGLEALANRTVLKNDNVHTAAIGVDKADKGAAYADADNNVFAQLHQTGRYEGVSGLRKGIEQNRRVFKNDVLEGARNVVSGSLDAQDTYGAGGMLLFAKDLQGANLVTEKAKRFSENAEKLLLEAGSRGFVGLGGIKNNYARAAAQYAKANGASYAMLVEIENGIRANIGQNAEPDAVQKAAGENAASMLLLQEARAYGIEQALKATFHDQNAIAQWLSDSEAKALRSKKTVLRAIGHLVEGILPFKSTPMNVLSRAVEYSPVGLATTILWDAPKAVVGKGEKTNADIIEQLASGLTGTGLFALGALLASMGALEIGGGEDDREEYYKKNVQGKQAYSLKFADGSTYTLDWLVPAAMPIFMGASTYAAWDGELDFGTLLDVSVKMSEPILETTMLSGLSDTIRSIANSRTIGLGDLGGALTSMAGSYAGQFVPVLAKQTGRAFSESAHSTYSGKQSGVARFADKQWKENTNWIPSLDDNLMYDQWGRPVDNVGNNAVGRLAYNLLSPGFYSKDKSTDVDRELNRLADAVGSTEVYPQSGIATASVTVGKETRRMSDEEMQTFSREKGRMSYGLLEAAMADKRYSAMSSQQKAKLVSSIYSLSGAYGRSKAVAGYELESEHAKPLALYETFGTKGVVDYYMTKSGANADGNSSLSNGELIPYLEKQSYTDAEKSALFAQMTKSDGKGYNSVKSKYGDDGAYEWMVWQANADVNRNGSASYSELIPVLEQVPKAKQADYLASAVPPKEGSKAEVIQQNYGNQGLLDLYTAKVYANTDGKGLTTKEAKAYLDKQAFTKAYKAALYEAMVGGDKNPYR